MKYSGYQVGPTAKTSIELQYVYSPSVKIKEKGDSDFYTLTFLSVKLKTKIVQAFPWIDYYIRTCGF